MGYTTDFYGCFELDKPLKSEHKAYLEAFSRTRRMKRNPDIAKTLPDPVRLAVGLPIGPDGAYFVGGTGFMGQDDDSSVINRNDAPKGQPEFPEFWCQWIPNDDGTAIVWDGGEKFYEYIPWIKYLIENFLESWEYILNGEVEWKGEDRDDFGKIVILNNVITVQEGRRTYGPHQYL